MTKLHEVNFLKAVKARAVAPSRGLLRPKDRGLQLTLFPRDEESLVTTYVLDPSSASLFDDIISYVTPVVIFDTRVSPRFDFPGLSRRSAFDVFAQCGSLYFDISGELGVTRRLDARLNPVFVGERAGEKTVGLRSALNVMFFIDRADDNHEYVENLVHGFSPSRDDWNWMRVAVANN